MATKQLALSCCLQIVAAYKQGERNCGYVDWNDVNEAWHRAMAALKQHRREVRARRKTSR